MTTTSEQEQDPQLLSPDMASELFHVYCYYRWKLTTDPGSWTSLDELSSSRIKSLVDVFIPHFCATKTVAARIRSATFGAHPKTVFSTQHVNDLIDRVRLDLIEQTRLKVEAGPPPPAPIQVQVVWSATFDDELFEAAVVRAGSDTGVLLVKQAGESAPFFTEQVSLSYAAIMGPDTADVARWIETSVREIDSFIARNSS